MTHFGTMEFVFGGVAGMLIVILLAVLIGLAGKVFLGFTVYHDARLRMDANAALWGVLSGVFDIAALIYLIVKLSTRNQPVRCPRCGNLRYPGMPACPVCGQPAPCLTPEQAAESARSRKRFLILWIVSYAAMIVLAIGAVIGFTLSFLRWM